MSQIVTKGLAANAATGPKIRLENNVSLRARNAANSADVNIIKLNASDVSELGVALNAAALRMFNMYLEPVQLAADPAGVTGQVYYNTVSNTLKFYNGTVWASIGSGGSGANTSLSNLVSPTALNEDLIFNMGGASTVQTVNDNAAATRNLTIRTGNATGFASGDLFLESGTADTGQTGTVNIVTGAPAVNIPSGSAFIVTGPTTGTGNSGDINMGSGNAVSTGSSGNLTLNSGSVASGASGAITLNTGAASASAGSSGVIQLFTGDAIDANSGDVILTSGGTSGTGATGNATMQTGNAVTGNSGNVSLVVGTAGGTQGEIILFKAGVASVIGQVWTASGVGGQGYWANAAAAPTWGKVRVSLSAGDITNQYYDLTEVALNNSVSALVKGQAMGIEDAADEYTLAYTGGAGGNTRINFGTNWATGGGSALVAGDILVVQFQY